HVLIIEDEPLLALEVEAVLAEVGASTFDVASTQDRAIELARRNPPALITSDVRLAVGRGPEAVEMIRAQLGGIPVIFITGSPEECQRCGDAAAILGKPFVPERLQQLFRSLELV
ncbi:MAG: response regulator, partial [Alphaproteobacteria bacterium]